MIRYGIIGAGRMGNAHASQTRELKGTSVSAVYDIRPEAAEKMHADYGARICGSANELASAPEVDCVIVTSPTYCHQEGVRAAVAANKPVFCEKALCRTPEIEHELFTLLKDYDKLFTVGFVRRHQPKAFLLLIEAVGFIHILLRFLEGHAVVLIIRLRKSCHPFLGNRSIGKGIRRKVRFRSRLVSQYLGIVAGIVQRAMADLPQRAVARSVVHVRKPRLISHQLPSIACIKPCGVRQPFL